MNFLFLLIIAAVAAYLLRSPLKAHPSLFYSIAAMLVLLYFFGATFGVPRWLWMPLVDLIQKCELAVALFAVVMLIGCLGKEQTLYRRMKPIRAELSIIACILCLGHMAVYLGSYLPRLLGNASINSNVARRLRRGRRTLRAARSSWRDVPRHREAGHEQPSLDAHPAIRLLILRSDILPSCAHASSCCPTRRRCRPRIAFRVYGGVRSLRNTAFGQSCCGAP